MLNINNLDISYGAKHLFKDLSARINEHDRIGLAGVNGAGKTTLLKIIAGVTETDAKTVVRPKQLTIAYLPQETAALDTGRTIYQEAETAFAETLALQEELTAINRQLSAMDGRRAELAGLLKRQADLQHRLEGADIFRMRSAIEKVLIGLGFKEAVFGLECRSLSGGWLMRLMLAKLLLANPGLLLLDEPTNHLDLESLTWLENYLLSYDGALVIISHDRTFLDRTTAITWELSLGKLAIYKGNYSKYLQEKVLRQQIEQAAYDNQQAKIKQTMRFVQRFRAKSTKAKQVQSRLKQLERLEKIEVADTESSVAFSFPPAAACGRLVLEADQLAKSFNGNNVFDDLSFQLQRGDKLAVIGVNGAGKSTLMKLLAGLEKADRGMVRLGHNVALSYFGQHQAQELDQDLTVLETMGLVSGEMTVTQVRSLLGAFLFRGDDVDKKVRVLSGGEKSRLALAKMIAVPANLLILDEPTNHLDMSSQDVLQEAMAQYGGTIVIVSHNRYFVNRFINKVMEVKAGRATLFQGNIDDYLAKVQAAPDGQKQGPAPPTSAAALPTGRPEMQRGKAARQAQARLRQEKNRLLAPLKKEVSRLELEIAALESRKTDLETRMADPELYRDETAFAGCSREYNDIGRRLERLYRQWEEAQGKIEQAEAEFLE